MDELVTEGATMPQEPQEPRVEALEDDEQAVAALRRAQETEVAQ